MEGLGHSIYLQSCEEQEQKFAELVCQLFSAGRVKDVELAATDDAHRRQLMYEYDSSKDGPKTPDASLTDNATEDSDDSGLSKEIVELLLEMKRLREILEANGRKAGELLFAELLQALFAADRIKDAELAAADDEYRHQLMREFGIQLPDT